MEKAVPKSILFVSLPFDSRQFHKKFMTKSETQFRFRSLGNQFIHEN